MQTGAASFPTNLKTVTPVHAGAHAERAASLLVAPESDLSTKSATSLDSH